MNEAIILLSGGLDSAVALADARYKGYEPFCIAFDYGQRHRHELECAAIQAEGDLEIVQLSLGGSALTFDSNVPENRAFEDMAGAKPPTYVPGRNTVFLSYAAARAEELGVTDVFIGANAEDAGGYPDCRPAYFAAFQAMVREWLPGFSIHTPLIDMTKATIIQHGYRLGVNFAHTSSCYQPYEGRPCGRCDACQLRAKGFSQAGINDPLSRNSDRG